MKFWSDQGSATKVIAKKKSSTILSETVYKYAVARSDLGAALVPQSRGSVFEREY